MKIRSFLVGAALIIGTAAITTQVVSQDAKQQPPMTPEEAALWKKWEAFMTPGEQHQMLAKRVGKWNHADKFWMDPKAEPSLSAGTCEFSPMLDGRYVTCHTQATMDGMPFEGMGCWGYDNLKKKYFFAWIDNMGTGIMVSEGHYDAKTKTLTYEGEGPNLEADKYEKMKTIERFESDDKWVMEMWCHKDFKEYKCMEIVYTRAD